MIVILAQPYVGFPNGMAATSRVTAYARGLAASGEDVRLILLGPSELDGATAANTEISGVHQGIPFEYTSVSTVKSPSFLRRRWRVVSSLVNARRRIRELAAGGDVHAVLVYTERARIASFFRPVSRAVGATYAVDLCEMPFRNDPESPTRGKRQERHGSRFIGQFDVVVAISRYLAEYAGRHLAPGAEVITVPIMVDCDEYHPGVAPVSCPRLVTYAGMLNEKKDGVGTLMTAFSRVAKVFPDAVLRLVGDSSDPARSSLIPEFRALAEGLGIADRVEFTGHVPRREVPRHLAEASVLVLARPSSQQADAGLPTKVGEYLAAGRPVIVTDTSDISEYLRDGESAFLVPPDDVDALTGALQRVLGDPAAADRVGAAGRSVAERSFDYRVACSTVAEALLRHRASGEGRA